MLSRASMACMRGAPHVRRDHCQITSIRSTNAGSWTAHAALMQEQSDYIIQQNMMCRSRMTMPARAVLAQVVEGLVQAAPTDEDRDELHDHAKLAVVCQGQRGSPWPSAHQLPRYQVRPGSIRAGELDPGAR